MVGMWISKKDYNVLKFKLATLNLLLEQETKKPYLVDVRREGIKLVFDINYEGTTYTLKTLPIVEGGKDGNNGSDT